MVAKRVRANPEKVRELFRMEEATLLCWEQAFEFCHRFRAADSLVRSSFAIEGGVNSIRYVGDRNRRLRTACVTGHRKIVQAGWNYGSYWCNPGVHWHQRLVIDEIKDIVRPWILLYDFANFISGGAIGADTLFAEAINELQTEMPEEKIHSLIARPFSNQPSRWSKVAQQRYNEMLLKADNVVTIGPNPHPNNKRDVFVLMDNRNKFMVDNSDVVLAVWDGRTKGGTWNCISYAHASNKKIFVLDPVTLKTYEYGGV
jgi:uncharacterized phage-like protein YoqJ